MRNIHFRRWWQPARKASEPRDARTVSFLELFYDLVYVVLVAEIAHALAAHPDPQGIWSFVFLFSIVWWSWFMGSIYHDAHGNNDIRTRVFTFAQMVAVAGMAVFAHNALGAGSIGFAIFFGCYQAIIWVLLWRLYRHDPEHAEGNESFMLIYGLMIVAIFLSVFVPTPYRFFIWVLAVLVNLSRPLFIFLRRANDSNSERAARTLHFSPALIERFGLFNILVLAEILVGVVSGLTHHDHLTANTFTIGGLGLCIAFAMWWLYFDFISHRHPIEKPLHASVWMYMHIFLTMSIVAAGAAVLNLVEHAGEGLEPTIRWLAVGAVATFLLSLTPLMRVIQVQPEVQRAYNNASAMLLFAAAVIGALGFTSLPTLWLMLVIVVLLLLPVVYAWVFYIKMLNVQEQTQSESPSI